MRAGPENAIRGDYAQYQKSGGGLKPSNDASPGNPMIPMGVHRYHQQQQNAGGPGNRDWMNENLASRYKSVGISGGGGGLRPGNDTSIGNPLNNYRPDYLQRYADNNKEIVAQQPYKQSGAKVQTGGGVKPGNDSSSENPLNRYQPEYLQSYAAANKEIVAQQPYKGGAQPSGGGVRPGNDSSAQNPLNNHRQDYLQQMAIANKQSAAANPLRSAAVGGNAGGLVKGNHTSTNNPLSVTNNPKYGQQDYNFAGDNDPSAEEKMHRLAQEMQRSSGRSYDPYSKAPPSQATHDPYDPYAGLTPKERLAAKRRDHYQQGSIPSTNTPVGARGGLSHSNETSSGNPLLTHDPRMLDYYKQANKQMVMQDPIKKGNRGRGPNTGFVGGHSGGGDMGMPLKAGGGGAQGPSDDGMVRKRGGVAMNL